jgi:hypothetical protein
MRQFLHLAAITLFLFLARTPAHASGLLALDFQGVAWIESSIGGTPIVGDSFTIQADFDPTTGTSYGQGADGYAPTSVVVTVAGTSYTVTDLSDLTVFLIDATNPYYLGYYYPALDNFTNPMFGEIAGVYTTATPAFSAADPTPTVFSGFAPSQQFGNALELSTAAGNLILLYDINVGIDASISSAPEPSSLVLCGIGGSIGLVVAWRRRKRAA